MILSGVRQQFSRPLLVVFCLVVFLTGSLNFLPNSALADEASPVQGIQISPVLIDLNAEKANSYKLKITVTNVTAKQLELKANINDFKAKDESGEPQVILDEKDTDPTFSLKSWAKPIPNQILNSKESRTLLVELNIPANAEAGGHYGVIRFSGFPPGQSSSNVSIAASVGVLVLARVNGQITENLNVEEVFIEKNNKRQKLPENGPLTIVERIRNDGNVHVKPTGNVTIKNSFGKTITTAKISEQPANILPKTTRRFSQTIPKKWLFGRYTARVEASYGYNGKTLSHTYSFWVIPYKLIFLVLVILIVLFFLFRFMIRGYNKRIIAKSRGH